MTELPENSLVMSCDRELDSLQIEKIDLSSFEKDPKLGTDIPMIIQLKGFNRPERIERRKEQQKQGRAGSSSERQISQGAIFGFAGLNPENILNEENAVFEYKLPDSRGLVVDGDTLYIGSVNQIHILNLEENSANFINNDWLAFIHSLDLSPDKKRLLVASSGFDRIIEFDLKTGQPIWYWSAWDHGYNEACGSDKIIVSYLREGVDNSKYIIVEDPKKFNSGLGLPPADRTAFPNSVLYKDEKSILATLYHNGLIEIDKQMGNVRQVFQGLRHPHAILRYKDGYMVTDTGNGRCIFFDKNLKPFRELTFGNLPDKDPQAQGSEWLQQVRPINSSLLAAIDSNRATIFIIDLEKRKINPIKYDQNWVIQELSPCSALSDITRDVTRDVP